MSYIAKLLKRFFEIKHLKMVLIFCVLSVIGILLIYALYSFMLYKGLYVPENWGEALPLLIGAIGACITIIYTHEDKSRELALNYVTQQRTKWLEKGRFLTADLCKYVWQYANVTKGCSAEYLSDLYGQIGGIIVNLYIRYNFAGKRDKVLLHILENMYRKIKKLKQLYDNKNSDVKDIEAIREQLDVYLKLLTVHSQIYFKIEWERIKEETLYSGNIRLRQRIIKGKMVKWRLALYKERTKYDEQWHEGFKGLIVDEIYQNLKDSDTIKEQDIV